MPPLQGSVNDLIQGGATSSLTLAILFHAFSVKTKVTEPGADRVPARAARVGWWMRPDHKLA
jgi:hypothetical protein